MRLRASSGRADALGEMDEHVAYIPITAASANALAMQTVELTAQTADKTTGSAILMRKHAQNVAERRQFLQL